MLRQLAENAAGTVEVRLRGGHLHRFFNACMRENITPLWSRVAGPGESALREGDGVAAFTVADFARLAGPAHESHTRVHILRRKGWFFRLRQFRGRPGFWLGLAVLLLAMRAMTGNIWVIEVQGCETVRPAQVLHLLAQEGIRPGMGIRDYDPSELRNAVLPKLHAMSWFTLRRQGCRLIVDVHERRTAEAAVETEPCDVVAARSGLVTRMEVMGGTAQILPEVMVEAGQVLIGGYYERTNPEDGTKIPVPMPASGYVQATVWDTVTMAVPETAGVKYDTGRERVRWTLEIGNARLRLYFGRGEPFADCNKTSQVRQLCFGEAHPLPVRLLRETYREYEKAVTVLPEDALRQTAQRAADLWLHEGYPGLRAAVTQGTGGISAGAYRLRMTIQSVQEIGKIVKRSENAPVRSETTLSGH